MKPFRILTILTLWILALALWGAQTPPVRAADPHGFAYTLGGQVSDPQGQPIEDAHIALYRGHDTQPIAETESLSDGTWQISLSEIPSGELHLHVSRAHYQEQDIPINGALVQEWRASGSYVMEALTLERRVTSGFWAATVVFLGVLLLIAFEKLHSTTAALTGASLIFLVSYFGSAWISPNLYIITFERALEYINWEVILLVMAMMIMIAIIEDTGIFQWLAFQSYRISRGRAWMLALILMALTAVASALLDNFTTMLLMTPISLQIGVALGINPLALIIPEVLASNVGGISTLVGTPTNILIGAYADIGFTDFLNYETGGVLMALVVMGAFVLYHYREEWHKAGNTLSPALYKRLQENARIEDPQALAKALTVFTLVMVGFVIGEHVGAPPAVPALIGASALLIWLKPDVHHMIKAVDWTTLVFFMALFIVVGAVQEVGLISVVAVAMSNAVGTNLPLATFAVLFGAGTFSVFIANIPLTASMLPIVEFLTGNIPGANSKVLYYALSMGAAMGGNGTLIGGEANLVTAGITAQTDSPITFKEFIKIGLPITYLTLVVGYLWLLIRF